MRLDFPRIVHNVPLSEYTPELKETVQVWVNPPVSTLSQLAALYKAYRETGGQDSFDQFLAILSDLLSQGREETHWTVDELKDMITRTADTDPLFWIWFQDRVVREINDHRTALKKA